MTKTTHEQHLRRALLTAAPYEAKEIQRELRAKELGTDLDSVALASRRIALVTKIRELTNAYGSFIEPYATWDEDNDEGDYVAQTAEAFSEMRSDFEDFTETMDHLLLEYDACHQALSEKAARPNPEIVNA